MAPSVVEDVPADRASAPLVVEDKVTHFDRDLIPLPSKFTHPCCLSFTSRGGSAGRPDRVGRGASARPIFFLATVALWMSRIERVREAPLAAD
jgi:hypothetical protein